MDSLQIYVACLAAYNNGILHGQWIDAAQDEEGIKADIANMLAHSPIKHAEEYAIHDYEGFGPLRIEEYESIATISAYASFIVEHGELGAHLLEAFGVDDAQRMLIDAYHGCYDSEVDFAWSLFEDCYSDQIPKDLVSYFDCQAFARDLFISDYYSFEVDGKTHVFSNY